MTSDRGENVGTKGDVRKTTSTAIFDQTHTHRYLLTRTWDSEKKSVLFIMLNPSTANGETNDPTIRRCINFAKAWGYGSLEVVNLFSLVSSDPKKLLTVKNSIGEDNDSFILEAADSADKIIVAWGAFPEARRRAAKVLNMLSEMGCEAHCLGMSRGGQPKHPLYLPKDVGVVRYVGMKGGVRTMSKGLRSVTKAEQKLTITRRMREKKGGIGYWAAVDAVKKAR